MLFAILLLSGIFGIKKASAGSTYYDDLFEKWEDQFNDRICPKCHPPIPEEEPTPEPCPEPEPTPEPEPEVEVEVEVEIETEIEIEVETEVEFKHESRKNSSCDGSIGNLVWNDENGNGLKDNGEKGIDDIKMTLKWIGRDFKWDTKDDEEMTTHTNKNGRYEFDDLCEGDYKIYVKDSDVDSYTQVYDPDGDPNNKAKVYLDGDKDDHTKADFGYAHRSTPATGSGTMMTILAAGTLSLLSFLTFKQLRRKLY